MHKVAAALRPRLERKALRAARLRDRGRLRHLEGRRVLEVAALGKHLLLACEGERVLHVHLGMPGRWHAHPAGAPAAAWERPPQRASLLLATDAWCAACFRAAVAEELPRAALRDHPVLARLGPDLLGPPERAEPRRLAARALAQPSRALGECLLDQRVACGIGNVYKSELCFVEGVHPATPVGALGEDALARLYARARELLRANLGGGRRSTVRPARPGSPPVPRLFVYGRAGRPCLRCGARVESALAGEDARPTYWCPACQPRRA